LVVEVLVLLRRSFCKKLNFKGPLNILLTLLPVVGSAMVAVKMKYLARVWLSSNWSNFSKHVCLETFRLYQAD
jgi:hypothetical protein